MVISHRAMQDHVVISYKTRMSFQQDFRIVLSPLAIEITYIDTNETKEEYESFKARTINHGIKEVEDNEIYFKLNFKSGLGCKQ